LTIRSSAPASSTPVRTRASKRPALDFRLTRQGYNRLDAATLEPAAQPVLLPLRPLQHGGPGRRLRRARARARPRAVGDPQRPVRPEPAVDRTAAPAARPAGGRARARRRCGRANAARAPELFRRIGAPRTATRAPAPCPTRTRPGSDPGRVR